MVIIQHPIKLSWFSWSNWYLLLSLWVSQWVTHLNADSSKYNLQLYNIAAVFLFEKEWDSLLHYTPHLWSGRLLRPCVHLPIQLFYLMQLIGHYLLTFFINYKFDFLFLFHDGPQMISPHSYKAFWKLSHLEDSGQ